MIRTVSSLALIALFVAVAAPQAHAAKVIVLAVEGDDDGDLEDGLSSIVEDRHDLVTSSQVTRAARKAKIRELDGPAIGKIARKLGADAVIEGQMSRDDEGFLFVVRVRAASGKTVKKISVDLRKPRLSAKAKRRLGTGILDGIDQVLGIEEEDEIEIEDDDEARDRDDDEDMDEDRVAARDDLDDEDLDRGVGVDRRGVQDDDEKRELPAFVVAVGPSAVMRQLSFTSRPYEQAPTGYKSSMVPGAHLEVQAFPLALKNKGAIAGLGIGMEYDQTLLMSTASSDAPMVKLPTEQKHWIVDARYRFAVGKKAQVTLKVGYGRRVFIVDRTGLPEGAELDMPDVDYRFYNPGLIGRYAVNERAGIHAGADALLFKATGYIQRATSYGAAKMTGVEARAGVDFKATDKIIVDVTGSYTQIGYQFLGNGEETYNRDLDASTADVGGAADRYIGVVGTVGYAY